MCVRRKSPVFSNTPSSPFFFWKPASSWVAVRIFSREPRTLVVLGKYKKLRTSGYVKIYEILVENAFPRQFRNGHARCHITNQTCHRTYDGQKLNPSNLISFLHLRFPHFWIVYKVPGTCTFTVPSKIATSIEFPHEMASIIAEY